ncbi:GDSL-type esterase/lipase family protein [Lentzea sp. NBC_00516]|uniref:GDSL-type esterase/lipase family protein n=1 Tax=Lentzea sp. NBC_00516 TaxID=2903582 RepID=UPI002E8089D7|nr:GDSL-type esterase/lipase family protein [Lentzea sp. NBC_00516]WUD27104.1 GDSL-type esterase/lipase family protein [Lentzea sp. NBC_00516]
MTITLNPASTVMFTGDSITGLWRQDGDDRAAYPLQVAGRWAFEHPDRPLTWLNTGYRGDTTADLEARWQANVLDARPDVLSILAATYRRLLTPLADAGTRLILIEPFLLAVDGVVEAGGMRIGEQERKQWREDLEPKIGVVRALAREYGAELLEADRMFTELSARRPPEHWAEDGVHPTAAGHSALAEAWLELVA